MLRYHVKTGFMPEDKLLISQETEALNSLNFKWTAHSLDNLKHRVIDTQALLMYIKNTKLEAGQVFEFYKSEIVTYKGYIEKICYRLPWNNLDVILVLDSEKTIITIYLNSKEDLHSTLNESLYTKV